MCTLFQLAARSVTSNLSQQELRDLEEEHVGLKEIFEEAYKMERELAKARIKKCLENFDVKNHKCQGYILHGTLREFEEEDEKCTDPAISVLLVDGKISYLCFHCGLCQRAEKDHHLREKKFLGEATEIDEEFSKMYSKFFVDSSEYINQGWE